MDRSKRINEVRTIYSGLLASGMSMAIWFAFGQSWKSAGLVVLMVALVTPVLNGRLPEHYVNFEMDQPRRFRKILWSLFILGGAFFLLFPVFEVLMRFRYLERWGWTGSITRHPLLGLLLSLALLHWIFVALELIIFYRLHRNDDVWIRLN